MPNDELTLVNGIKNTNIVQKSKPLFSLWKSDLTLSEFKILDTYLSRINSRHPEKRSVIFEKGELERLLCVTKINKQELQKRLRHLQSTIVSIGEGKNIDEITLFERSQAIQDENGLWQIKLTASQPAMKYIFNIEKLGYFRYRIQAIVKLKSLYSYTLLMYLEYNKYKGIWSENLDELKKILSCNNKLYNEYKYFNQRILNHCQKEIIENTLLYFSYTPIKKGRKVVAIEFKIQRTPDKQEINTKVVSHDENNSNLIYQEEHPECQSNLSGDFGKDLKPNEIELLCGILADKVPNKPPESLERLLKSLYNEMTLKSKEPVKKPVLYLLRMINNLEPEKIKEETRKLEDDFCVEKYELLSKYNMLRLYEDEGPEYDNIRQETLKEIEMLKAIVKEKTGEEL